MPGGDLLKQVCPLVRGQGTTKMVFKNFCQTRPESGLVLTCLFVLSRTSHGACEVQFGKKVPVSLFVVCSIPDGSRDCWLGGRGRASLRSGDTISCKVTPVILHVQGVVSPNRVTSHSSGTEGSGPSGSGDASNASSWRAAMAPIASTLLWADYRGTSLTRPPPPPQDCRSALGVALL